MQCSGDCACLTTKVFITPANPLSAAQAIAVGNLVEEAVARAPPAEMGTQDWHAARLWLRSLNGALRLAQGKARNSALQIRLCDDVLFGELRRPERHDRCRNALYVFLSTADCNDNFLESRSLLRRCLRDRLCIGELERIHEKCGENDARRRKNTMS
jgi:hypothetical protein